MDLTRSSGLLLHITSLPGDFGIGDLGPSAYQFIDFLAESKQTYWQVLPLSYPQQITSGPYQNTVAGNPLLISPELLVQDGLLTKEEINNHPQFSASAVQFSQVSAWKTPLLQLAAQRFLQAPTSDYHDFILRNEDWLPDFSLFHCLSDERDYQFWIHWEKPLRDRDPHALLAQRQRLAKKLEEHCVIQYFFDRQWRQLHARGQEKNIQIIGDLPLYPSLNSFDVWSNPQYFNLSKEGHPLTWGGVPPDTFSSTGQDWHVPTYNWPAIASDGFKWWAKRIERFLEKYDMIRLDHFLGYVHYWSIPAGHSAVDGEWIPGPGISAFLAINSDRGLPFLVEDIGPHIQDCFALRDRFRFPGMRILQFGFGPKAGQMHQPHKYPQHCVAYTGYHDSDTVAGWYSTLPLKEKEKLDRYVSAGRAPNHWDLIRLVWQSKAAVAIAQVTDILGLGKEARFNVPGTMSGNWEWRLTEDQLSPTLAEKLGKMTKECKRAPQNHLPLL
jgi:4-alpha-glucanotransferase